MAFRLHIKICEAKKVLKMDLGGRSDPYVTIKLKSQDKKDVQKTVIMSNTTDPIWNQEFDIFVVDPNDVLIINMYDEDYQNDDKMMDELQFPVNTWPVGGPLDRKELDIKLKKKKAGKFIFEAQAFPFEKGCKIHIKAFDAKDILKMDIGGRADPYLRFGLKGKKDNRIKTRVITNTRNPIWNEEFEIISTDRQNDVLEVCMFNEDIKYDDHMMDKIFIPLNEHPIGTHYIFNQNIKLKKKNAGSLHFELDFTSLDPDLSDESSTDSSKTSGSEQSEEEDNSDSQIKIQVTKSSVNLLTNVITHVPLNNYEKDFTFVVNGQQFKTSKIVSDLISPKISEIHQNDPTLGEFYITTKTRGNFQTVLDLVSFEPKQLNEDEIEFVSEIFGQLGIEKASVKTNNFELKIENIIGLIENHEKSPFFYSSNLSREIDFLSSHFYELDENQRNQLLKISMGTIEKVISNDHLQLESEDQLLSFINQLYKENNQYSKLYEYVMFSNVKSDTIGEFLTLFDFYDLTAGTWLTISERLHSEIYKKDQENKNKNRYRMKIPFLRKENNLKGIFNFIQKDSNIEDEIKVTTSSYGGGDLHQLIQIENTDNNFYTNNENNPWICFEFKKHKIVPTNYTIRSCNSYPGSRHPKSWIIEGSNDNKNWTKIDEQQNCSFLNGPKYLHTFSIKKIKENNKEKEFKFIRIMHTNRSWDNYNNILNICSIEFYGELV